MTVAQVMVTNPKTLSADATVGEVLDVFDDDHVHMVLLTEGAILIGTIERGDLPAELGAAHASGEPILDEPALDEPALGWSSLDGRTIPASASALVARELMLARGSRRSAVVDSDGVLLGLLCLKRRLTGFCSDADVAARAADRSRGVRTQGECAAVP